jgi:hypothetical protein
VDRLDAKAILVAEQERDVEVRLGRLQGDHLVGAGVLHVDDRELPPLAKLGQKQTTAVHRTREDRPQREVEGPRAALVGGKDEKGLGRPLPGVLGELDLRRSRSRPTDVPRGGVGQQVLPRTIEALLFRYLSARFEGCPCQVVDVGMPGALLVHHQQTDIVTREGHSVVQK